MSASSARNSLLQQLLEPVVRVCLRYGYSIQDLLECAKAAFVVTARKEIERNGEQPNVSRLSIMSGLHRRDVTRLLEKSKPKDSDFSIISRVVGQWSNDRRFSSKAGEPLPLSCSSNSDDFALVVFSVSKDLHPGTILFEMQRRGIVSKVGEQIALSVSALDSHHDDAEGLEMLSEDINDLTGAVLENLGSEAARALHAKTEFDRIPSDRGEEIRHWMLKRGAKWHAEIREYLASLDLDTSSEQSSSSSTIRVAVGSFGLIDNSNRIPSPLAPESKDVPTTRKRRKNGR